MKITFHGAARTVTGSQILLEVNGARLLLECGLYQGRRAEAFERNRVFPFDPSSIQSVILSHAHIDHSGNLPNLVKCGYGGPIYATRATVHLADVMLRDSGHIQEADAEFVNKRRARRGEPPVEPLYTRDEATYVSPLFQPVGYGKPFQPAEGVTARLFDAGHILGSAGVCLDIEENGKTRRLWFSGDVGRPGLPLIKDPVKPQDCDFVIMECTYGNKLHSDASKAYGELREVINRTVKRNGKIIIPAFAVGRTQELVYHLNRLASNGEIARIPVYVDSPLAADTTEVFRRHPECFDKETFQFLAESGRASAFGFDMLTYVRSSEASKALNDLRGPAIIISASGMAEHGRILHHLRHTIGDPRNTILIVSWQAPYTLGRRLAERETWVRIFGEAFERRAEVVTIGSFSAHAGQDYLLKYMDETRGRVQQVFLVHGEAPAAQALTEKLAEAGMHQVSYPEIHSQVEL